MKYQIFDSMERYVSVDPEVPLTLKMIEKSTGGELSLIYDSKSFVCKLTVDDKVVWESKPLVKLERLEKQVEQKGYKLVEKQPIKQHWAYIKGKRHTNLSLKALETKMTVQQLKRNLTKQYGKNVEFKFEV